MTTPSLFEAHELALPGVLLITPKVFSDPRGDSVITYNAEEFAKLGITARFEQDFVSYSLQNVIRGLHYQRAPHAQDKLVRCTEGEIFDVVADHDPASVTFGSYVSATLTSGAHTMLYVPGRYAHGFCVTSESAVVAYKIAGTYSPAHAGGVLWNDPLLHIAWPTSTPILSEQDNFWQPIARQHKN